MTRTLKKHSTDLVSLVAGVIFLGVVGTWALGRNDLLDGFRGWVLPVLLIGVGLIGLIGIRPRRTDVKAEEPARSDGTGEGEDTATGSTTRAADEEVSDA